MADEAQSPTAREFYRTIKERWFIAMASGIGVLAWATAVIFPKIGAVQIILICSMTAVILSAYHIWAQERTKLVAALGQLADTYIPGGASGRDEFIVLAGQLRHFLDVRSADYSSQFEDKLQILENDLLASLDYSPFGSKRARDWEARKREHNDSTLQLYGDRFASHVIAANRRLRELGVGDAETVHLGRYPRTIADIEAVGRELEAASTLLPSLPTSDVAALHQANTLLKNEIAELRAISAERHLDEDKQRAISQVVRTGLRDLWELYRASPSWTADDKEVSIFVHLYTMENDRETIRYRADFAKAFQAGGLSVALGEFLGTSGEQENDQFVGTVSLIRGNPGNLVRPFVLDALRSAGISVNECDNWPRSLTQYSHSNADSSGVTLIIGQRS